MYYLKLLPFLLLGLLACKPTPDVTPGQPDPIETPTEPGTPTEVGQPAGVLTTKTIGPAGGAVSTPDGRLTLTFPAGALVKETFITVQPIENKAFGGAGLAYRFGPDGSQFAKPVTLTWHYQPEDIEGSAPEALGIAFQDKQGVWQGSTEVKVDKSAKTVSGQLAHFSDWAFYEQFYLAAVEGSLRALIVGDHAKLAAYYQQDRTDKDHKMLLTPLIQPKLIRDERVVRWTINGTNADDADFGNNGQFTTDDSEFAQGTYDAPPRVPDTNPVALAVELDLIEKGHLILIQTITITSSNRFSLAGVAYNNPSTGLLVTNGEMQGIIYDPVSLVTVTFAAPASVGTHHVTPTGSIRIAARTSTNLFKSGYQPLNGEWQSGDAVIRITGYNGNKSPATVTISGSLFRYDGQAVPISGTFRAVPSLY